MHVRLRRERGPAKDHACKHCGVTARDWAYDHSDPDELPSPHGPYSLDPDRYMPLCRSCHRRYDEDHRRSYLT